MAKEKKEQMVEQDKVDYSALSYDELRQISRNDHQEDVRQYDKQQNALCLVMIGAICLIAGILFILLSFKRVKNKMGGVDFTSLQFFVSIACFVGAAILLSIGLIRFFKAHKIRKQLKEEITLVSQAQKVVMSNEK